MQIFFPNKTELYEHHMVHQKGGQSLQSHPWIKRKMRHGSMKEKLIGQLQQVYEMQCFNYFTTSSVNTI